MDTMRQIWQWLENSPKRMAAYLKIQANLKKMSMPSGKGEKVLTKKLSKACTTRWLSFDDSVKAIKQEYITILSVLEKFDAENDATSGGLLKRVKDQKFLGMIYVLAEILPILADLSKNFQEGTFSFSGIVPAVQNCIAQLQKILEESTALDGFEKDIDSKFSLIMDIKIGKKISSEIVSTQKKYINSLIKSIRERFPEDPVLAAFDVLFNPLNVPDASDEEFNDYGIQEAKIIAKKYFPEKESLMVAQWNHFKHFICHSIKPKAHPPQKKSIKPKVRCLQKKSIFNPVVWLLKYMMKNKHQFQLFSQLVYIAEVCLTLPVSNAWPERGFSAMKIVKTRLRSSLKNDMLNSLLQVLINGPEVAKSGAIIKAAVKIWLADKKRYKTSQQPKKVTNEFGTQTTQTDQQAVEEMEQEGQPELSTSAEREQDVEDNRENILALYGFSSPLNNISDSDADSAFDSDFDDF